MPRTPNRKEPHGKPSRHRQAPPARRRTVPGRADRRRPGPACERAGRRRTSKTANWHVVVSVCPQARLACAGKMSPLTLVLAKRAGGARQDLRQAHRQSRAGVSGCRKGGAMAEVADALARRPFAFGSRGVRGGEGQSREAVEVVRRQPFSAFRPWSALRSTEVSGGAEREAGRPGAGSVDDTAAVAGVGKRGRQWALLRNSLSARCPKNTWVKKTGHEQVWPWGRAGEEKWRSPSSARKLASILP